MKQLKMVKQPTDRSSISFDKYLQDVSKEELITADEEVDLARRIKQGDQAALEKLTRANLRFVVSVSKQYQNQGISLPDLINEGNLGLIKAAQRFDETRWFKFISYAVWRIRQSILQTIAEQWRIVRLPLNKIGSMNKINRMFAVLEQEYERPPTVEELAKVLDMPRESVNESLRISWRHVSFDATIHREEDATLIDIFPDADSPSPDKDILRESLVKEVERSLWTLPDIEAEVIRLYYGIGKTHGLTLEEVGERLGIPSKKVESHKKKAIRRLRGQGYRNKLLKPYLG